MMEPSSRLTLSTESCRSCERSLRPLAKTLRSAGRRATPSKPDGSPRYRRKGCNPTPGCSELRWHHERCTPSSARRRGCIYLLEATTMQTIENSTYSKVTCGELRAEDVGRKVQLNGWVHRRRDQGALIFIDLRDRWGLTQLVFNRETNPQAHQTAEEARSEYVLRVEGTVAMRGPERANPNLSTGEIEIVTDRVTILNRAKALPFEIASS